MNIVLILADQYRYDCLSALDHPVVQTPHLDSLARQGTHFTRAYCATMACAPARASIFTGYHAATHGMAGNQTRLQPPDRPVLPEFLARAGYDTALVGKLHLKPIERDYGFRYLQRHDAPYTNYAAEEATDSAYLRYLGETVFAHNPQEAVDRFTEDEACLDTDELRFMLGSGFLQAQHHEAAWAARESIRYLRRERRPGQPFFLNCSFFGPHQPFLCPPPWDQLYPPESIPLPPAFDAPVDDKAIFASSQLYRWRQRRAAAGWDEAVYRRILSAYYGYVAFIDHQIGQLFGALKEEGLWDNTLVVFAADHGDFGGQFRSFYKGLAYEGSAHVPLIVKDPRQAEGTAPCAAPVGNMDLFATCLGAAGIKGPADSEARDLAGLLQGDADGWDRVTYYKKGTESCLVRDHLKLMRADTADGVAYECYDLDEDPWEQTDCVDRPAYADGVAALQGELDAWHAGQEERAQRLGQQTPREAPAAAFQVPALWAYSPPLIAPEQRPTEPSHAQKDPTVVFYEGQWHVFMSAKLPGRSVIEYCSFEEWDGADRAPRTILQVSDGDYYCAPQVFYFAPHGKWYLIYQMGVPGADKMWVAYSTSETIADPNSWTPAAPMLDGGAGDPRPVGGLDYWIICDEDRAYLFYTDLKGKMWRLWTDLADFPHGFDHCQVALEAAIFEASHTYYLKGVGKYLTIVEEDGRRYYKAYLADRLDGVWTPLADTAEQPFAGWRNIRPAPGVAPWTDNISHGELVRDGYDQRLSVDPDHLRFVFQGMWDRDKAGKGYGQFQWRIGLLAPTSVREGE